MRRLILALGLVVALVVAAVVGVRALIGQVTNNGPSCTLGQGASALDLDPEQAADAATIAAVAKTRGLPNHAVTIALAAALQESKLYNLGYGDRDSLGVFQQRPSEGWGTPAQLIQPAFAASAFFAHLARISGWQTLPVATAAQLVQHSADGSAYAQWEEEARALARALTGEITAGLSCKFADHRVPKSAALTAAATTELGASWTTGGANLARDWTVAEWLVAHSYAYGIVRVEVRGSVWDNRSGRWHANARGSIAPTYRLAPLPSH